MAARLRRVQTHDELAAPGDFAVWPDRSLTIHCPFCGKETWLNPAPIMVEAPITLNGAQTLVCGHRLWLIAGRAEL